MGFYQFLEGQYRLQIWIAKTRSKHLAEQQPHLLQVIKGDPFSSVTKKSMIRNEPFPTETSTFCCSIIRNDATRCHSRNSTCSISQPASSLHGSTVTSTVNIGSSRRRRINRMVLLLPHCMQQCYSTFHKQQQTQSEKASNDDVFAALTISN